MVCLFILLRMQKYAFGIIPGKKSAHDFQTFSPKVTIYNLVMPIFVRSGLLRPAIVLLMSFSR